VSDKPKVKVLVAVLCGNERNNWINPALCENLLAMAADRRYEVKVSMILNKFPVHHARNFAVVKAREHAAHWLLLVDCDQAFSVSPLDVLSAAGMDKPVIGFPTSMGQDVFLTDGKLFRPNVWPEPRNKIKTDGQFYTCFRIGAGALLIHHSVWESIPGPWFLWESNESSELAEVAKDGSEDLYFCRLLQKHGIDVWAHAAMLYHFKSCECTQLGDLENKYLAAVAQRTPVVDASRWVIPPR
jgi:hypothetical protein